MLRNFLSSSYIAMATIFFNLSLNHLDSMILARLQSNLVGGLDLRRKSTNNTYHDVT